MNIARLSRAVIRQLRSPVCRILAANSPPLVKCTTNGEFRNQRRNCSVFSKSPEYSEVPLMDLVTFEGLCAEALESLTDYFEEIVEADPKLQTADVAYSDGVLTIKLGSPHGTYVINRQTPNRQIWLSSPTSGPKRYDYVDGKWIYKHDGVSMHELLQTELSEIISTDLDFLKLAGNKK